MSDNIEIIEKSNYDLICSALKAQPSSNEFIENYIALIGKLSDISEGLKKREKADTYLDLCYMEPLVNNLIPYEFLNRVLSEMRCVVSNPKLFNRKRCAVGGGFSSGKSSFINSFMLSGTTRLATAIKPTTALPCFVMSGSEPTISGVSPHFGVFSLPRELYKGIDHNLLATLPFNIKKIISYITVETPLDEKLFEHISLIDTPGYDAAALGTSSDDIKTAKKSLANADCLIWVIGLDANGTVKDSDLSILEDLEFGHDRSRPLYVVANKAELKTPAQLEEILDNFEEVLDDSELHFAGISAYSSNLRKEFLYRKLSLRDFFVQQNQQSADYNGKWKDWINKAFGLYITAIQKQSDISKTNVALIENLKMDALKYNISENTFSMCLQNATQGLLDYFSQIDNIDQRMNMVISLRDRFTECVDDFCKSVDITIFPEKMFCISCGNELSIETEVCPVCCMHQTKEIKICRYCGMENRPNAEFCLSCGSLLRNL
jgi:GTPase SAR1 family protein